jgi:hypothetical protein
MTSRSRVRLPRLPRRRNRWQRIVANTLQAAAVALQIVIALYIGMCCAASVPTGFGGTWYPDITLADWTLVAYGIWVIEHGATRVVTRWYRRRGRG